MVNPDRKDLWTESYEAIRGSERAAFDLGVFVLKVVMTINAGALVSIIAAHEHLKGTPGALQFFCGLLMAVAASVFAYFWQRRITESLWHNFYRNFPVAGRPPPFRHAWWQVSIFQWVAVPLVIASYVLFTWGGWLVYSAIARAA